MIVVTIRWLLTIFATASGVAKVYGVALERGGAEELDLPYVVLRIVGAAHLAAAVCLISDRPVLGALLLGTSYVPLMYVALGRGQHTLAWACVAVVALTAAFAWVSGTRPPAVAPARAEQVSTRT